MTEQKQSTAFDRDHYPENSAEHYEAHHNKNLRTRLTNFRELQVLRHALAAAGNPSSVLDAPCGTGRFWPGFRDCGVTNLIGADISDGMLRVAQRNRLADGVPSVLIKTSVFAMDIADNAVDFAACLRFYHHLAMAADRKEVLAELKRVSRRYVALSMWVDGNLAGRRRMRRMTAEPEQPTPGYGRRVCLSRPQVEAEFHAAGLRIINHYDVWPKLSMWRLYLLDHTGA